METAIARSNAPALGWVLRISWHALAIWVLSGGLVLYLGLSGGGYDAIVRSQAAVVVWWIVLVGAACAVVPVARPNRTGWVALILFAAFLAWSAIAATWSLSAERSLDELSRLAGYLGVLVLAISTFGGRRRALAHCMGAVASAIVVIVAAALLSRLHPGLFAGARTTGALLPGASGRLSWPLNYWNALAALVALGLPLLLGLATSSRRLGAQACAAAAIPALALCGYLTFSRGGAVAAAAGVLAFIALAPDRIPKLGTLLAAAIGSAGLIAGAAQRHAIEKGLTGADATAQGKQLLIAIVLVCAGVGLTQLAIGLAARHANRPRLMQVSVAQSRALLATAVVVLAVVFVAASGPRRLSDAWTQFKAPSTAQLLSNRSLSRFGSVSGNGRYTYWQVGVKAMPGHWLGGFGPGSFQLVWLPRATVASYVRNAHSLYVETLVEVGVVGLIVLAAFLLFVLAAAVRRVVRSRFEQRTLAAAVTAALFAFVVAAASDWFWQVPVLPSVFLLLAGAVLAPRRRRRRNAPSRSRGSDWAVRTATIAAAVICLLVIAIPMAGTAKLRESQAAAAAGNDQVALADARSALRVEPDSASAQLQVALVLELMRDVPGAVKAAQAATASEPDNWQTWLILSRLQAEAGAPQAAIAAMRRARALDPQSFLF